MTTPQVIEPIVKANAGREPRLVARKLAAMRAGEFQFFRGTCELFYRQWQRDDLLDSSPAAWVCGDLHVENFGSYKGDNRLTYFDLNDFDESARAPAAWDTARLLASVLVSAPSIGLTEQEAAGLTSLALDAYVTELRAGKPRWIERETARGIVSRLLSQVGRRGRPELLDHYSKVTRHGKTRKLVPDGEHILPVTDTERERAASIIGAVSNASPEPGFFNVIDVARRVAGTGSLGVERFVVLVEGRGSPDRNLLIDVKQQVASSLAAWSPLAQRDWPSEGDRVCAVQHRAQAVSPALLRPVSARGLSYVVKELQPIADRINLASWSTKPHKLATAIQTFARLAAWAQLRTVGWHHGATADEWCEFAARDDWQVRLLDRALDAAGRNASDYSAYCDAYDAGAFAELTAPRAA